MCVNNFFFDQARCTAPWLVLARWRDRLRRLRNRRRKRRRPAVPSVACSTTGASSTLSRHSADAVDPTQTRKGVYVPIVNKRWQQEFGHCHLFWLCEVGATKRKCWREQVSTSKFIDIVWHLKGRGRDERSSSFVLKPRLLLQNHSENPETSLLQMFVCPAWVLNIDMYITGHLSGELHWIVLLPLKIHVRVNLGVWSFETGFPVQKYRTCRAPWLACGLLCAVVHRKCWASLISVRAVSKFTLLALELGFTKRITSERIKPRHTV